MLAPVLLRAVLLWNDDSGFPTAGYHSELFIQSFSVVGMRISGLATTQSVSIGQVPMQ